MYATMMALLAETYPAVGANPLAAGGGGTCSYLYADHDGTPVVSSASCTISAADLDTGSEPEPNDREYVRQLGEHDHCDNDDAGHILANRLGGKAVPPHLFPQSPHLNRGDWESFERQIYACISSGNSRGATLKWEFDYSTSSDLRPTSATYSASFSDTGSCDSVTHTYSNACSKSVALGAEAASK